MSNREPKHLQERSPFNPDWRGCPGRRNLTTSHSCAACQGARGFTLIELLVAMAVVALIVVLLGQAITSSASLWTRTRDRANTFQEAREGFSRMRETLGGAVSDARLEFVDASGRPRDVNDRNFLPTGVARNSALHFVSGPASEIVPGGTAERTPGQAVFLQAALGLTSGNYGVSLEGALNATGFWVEYSDLSASLPPFLRSSAAAGPRFRLMQWIQPSEELAVYSSTGGDWDWFQSALPSSPGSAPGPRVLAEDIFALIVLPKVSQEDEAVLGGAISPDFRYDSRAWEQSGPYVGGSLGGTSRAAVQRNQLPPLIEIVAFGIERTEADRLYAAAGDTPPADLAIPSGLFTDASRLDADIATFEQALLAKTPPVRPRIFRATIPINSAIWQNP